MEQSHRVGVVQIPKPAIDPVESSAEVRALDIVSLAVTPSVDARPPHRPLAAPFGGEFPMVSVVVPALNEALNLQYVLPLIPTWVAEVILVDGGSTDDTVSVACALLPGIKVVTQTGRGKGDALRAGFSSATGEIIVMLDADGSTVPTEIPAFVGVLLAGADFAKGSRFSQGGGSEDISFWRWIGNAYFVLMARLLFGGRYTDLCYGYNAFWRRHLPTLDLDADGFEVETMMNLRALQRGLKVAEVASFEACRKYGTSRLRAIPDGLRVLRIVLRERMGLQGRRWNQRRLRRERVLRHTPTMPVATVHGIEVTVAETVEPLSAGIAS